MLVKVKVSGVDGIQTRVFLAQEPQDSDQARGLEPRPSTRGRARYQLTLNVL